MAPADVTPHNSHLTGSEILRRSYVTLAGTPLIFTKPREHLSMESNPIGNKYMKLFLVTTVSFVLSATPLTGGNGQGI